MLLLQMWLTQDAASRALAMVGTSDFVDQAKLYGNLAVKLQRTLTTQMDTLAKLRRGGVQRVQHDHFYHVDNRGGQAVFGPVVQGGANGNIEHQSHATNIPGALSPPMPCTDAAGNVVPISCREGQEAVPDARRDESRRVPGE